MRGLFLSFRPDGYFACGYSDGLRSWLMRWEFSADVTRVWTLGGEGSVIEFWRGAIVVADGLIVEGEVLLSLRLGCFV